MRLGFGCLASVAALAAVVVVVDRLTSAHLPPDLRWFAAGAAGLLLTLGLSSVWTLLRGYGQGDRSRAAVLERAKSGTPPSQDGPFVVTGVVRAEGETLRAPVSGVDCVAYQYRLYTSQWLPGHKHREVPIYWGYAARPFRIDSAAHSFRVIAVPQLRDTPTQHTSDEARARAKRYLAVTRFEPGRALAGIAASVADMVKAAINEPSGDVRRDWQAEGVTVDVDSLPIEETVVAVGSTVSIAGRWSSERRAIVPGELAEGELGVTVVSGPAEGLGQSGASELPSSVWSVALTAVLLLAAGAGIVWLSLTGQLAAWWQAH